VNVLVDTSVWSLALRRLRPRADGVTAELAALIHAGRVQLLGAVRQKLLSGIRDRRGFDALCRHLRAFPDVALETSDYEDAGAFFTRCRVRGVQGANTDFLICAVAARRDYSIFTVDRDFTVYSRILPIRLHRLP
jgi:predicted nucleic acid-binding protein